MLDSIAKLKEILGTDRGPIDLAGSRENLRALWESGKINARRAKQWRKGSFPGDVTVTFPRTDCRHGTVEDRVD